MKEHPTTLNMPVLKAPPLIAEKRKYGTSKPRPFSVSLRAASMTLRGGEKKRGNATKDEETEGTELGKVTTGSERKKSRMIYDMRFVICDLPQLSVCHVCHA
jgi:hypothetical protein